MIDEETARRALSVRRLARAHQHLKAARDLLLADDFADSVSRAYYAVFQAARALLGLHGLESRKHSGVVSLFNRHFVKTGTAERVLGATLKAARQSRELADYSDLAEFTPEDAEAQLREADFFVRAIEQLLRAEGVGVE